MVTVTEYLRNHLYKKLNYYPKPKNNIKILHWNDKCDLIIKLMQNRLEFGKYRTVGLDAKLQKEYNNGCYIKFILNKLQKYLNSGNAEFLIDVMNGALLEILYGEHKNKHFNPDNEERIIRYEE